MARPPRHGCRRRSARRAQRATRAVRARRVRRSWLPGETREAQLEPNAVISLREKGEQHRQRQRTMTLLGKTREAKLEPCEPGHEHTQTAPGQIGYHHRPHHRQCQHHRQDHRQHHRQHHRQLHIGEHYCSHHPCEKGEHHRQWLRQTLLGETREVTLEPNSEISPRGMGVLRRQWQSPVTLLGQTLGETREAKLEPNAEISPRGKGQQHRQRPTCRRCASGSRRSGPSGFRFSDRREVTSRRLRGLEGEALAGAGASYLSIAL